MIDEVNRVGLSALFVDFERPDPRRAINCSILEAPHLLTTYSLESQEPNIDLYMMAGPRQIFNTLFTREELGISESDTVFAFVARGI